MAVGERTSPWARKIICQRLANDISTRLAKEAVETLVAIRLVTLLFEGPLVQLLQTKAENLKQKL